MSAPHWEFLLTDIQGNPLGELTEAKERKVTIPLNRVAYGSFVVDTSNRWVNTLRKQDLTFVKVYRINREGIKVCVLWGPVINTQKVRSSGSSNVSTLAVNFAGIGWRLEKRLIEESKGLTGVEYGTPSAMIPVAEIITKIINGLNKAPIEVAGSETSIPESNVTKGGLAKAFNEEVNLLGTPIPLSLAPTSGATELSNTGIRMGETSESTMQNTAGPWYYQNALQAIYLLAATNQGFDWEIEPVDPVGKDGTGLIFGKLNMRNSAADFHPNVVWEYGDGKNNVREFTELIDATGNLNRAYSIPGGWPESAVENVVQYYNWKAIEERGCIYEDTVPANITSEKMRNFLLAEQVLVRKEPKTVITFKPTNDPTVGVMPEFGPYVSGGEWDIGDIFTFRAVEYEQETFNGLCRVYEVSFEIDELGNENMTPVLISQDV